MNGRAQNIDTWEAALPSRIKTLLLTAPIHRLEENKIFRGITQKDQDFRLLCLRIIDATIERMGLSYGASRSEILSEVAPLVIKADPSLDPKDAKTIVELAIEELLNEKNRRQRFQEKYSSVEAGELVSRTFSFHLLEEVSPDGNIYLQVTNEGIHLYAGMLGYNIEDAQVANEMVLQYQIARGRLRDAVQTAREADFRSIQLEQKIQAFIHAAQRDIKQVDWLRDALTYLKEARKHINQRLQTEKQILNAVEEKFSVAGDTEIGELALLKAQVGRCIERHMSLHKTVMQANPEYLAQQLLQGFKMRTFSRLPEMDREIMQPALKLTIGQLEKVIDHIPRTLGRLRQPQVFTLKTAMDKFLAPIRQQKGEQVDTDLPDLSEIPPEPPVFADEDYLNVGLLLQEISEEVSLSSLLREAETQQFSKASQQCLVLHALMNFGAEDGSEAYPVLKAEGEFESAHFQGDDLLVRRQA